MTKASENLAIDDANQLYIIENPEIYTSARSDIYSLGVYLDDLRKDAIKGSCS